MCPFFFIGNFFIGNFIAILIFSLKIRFPCNSLTPLDYLFYFYLFSGLLTYIFGLYLISADELELYQWPDQLKSFIVFMTASIYFGVKKVEINTLISSLSVITIIGMLCLICQYLFIYFIKNDYSVFSDRGMIGLVNGWPSRWTSFLIVFYFYLYTRISHKSRKIDLLLFFVTALLVFLSGTRSAILSIIFGHFILLILNGLNILKITKYFIILLIVLFFGYEFYYDLFRVNEIFNYSGNSAGSLQYRLEIIWPAIIDSLSGMRLIFGWGHLGVFGMPTVYYGNADIAYDSLGNLLGSAESQIFDVLVRQGYLGLFLFIGILIAGWVLSYRLFLFTDRNNHSYLIWKSSLAWQVAIAFQGITVETVRFSIFGFFYIVFLGVLSCQYKSKILTRVQI